MGKIGREGGGWRGSMALAVALLAACSQPLEPGSEEIAKAQTLYSQGAYAEARAQLQTLISADPANDRAFRLLGEIAEKQGDAGRALQYYGKVLDLKPDDVEVRIHAARLFLGLNDVVRAEATLKFVKDFRPNDTRVLSLDAAILERKGDLNGAIAAASKLVATEPAAVDPALLLAELYGKIQEWAKGEAVLRAALEKNPNEGPLSLALAQNLIAQGQPRDAEELLRKLMAREPGVFPYQMRLALLYSNENRLDEAEELLRKAVNDDESDERRILALADFLAERRSKFLAEQELVNAIFNRPQSITLRVALGDLYEKMLNLDGAEKVFRDAAELVKTGPIAHMARVRAGGLLLRLGEFSECAAQVDAVLQEDPQNLDAILLRGKLAMVAGDPTRAVEDFRTVLAQRSESFEVLSMLVRAYVASGQSQLAEQGLRRSIEISPQHEGVRIELIQLLGVQKRLDEALAETERLLVALPDNLLGLQAKVDIYIAMQDWDKAEAQARYIQRLYPDLAAGYLQLGHIYFTEARYDKAEEAYKAALAKAPLDYNALQSLAQAIALREGVAAAQNYMEGFLKGYASHPTAYNILGEIYMQRNDHTKAEAAFVRAYQLNPTWLEPYKNLARLYYQRGEADASVQVFLNGLSVIPDSVQLAFLLAMTYDEVGKYDEAIDTYEGILAKRPRMDEAANNLALLLVERRGDPISVQRALEVVERFTTSSSPVFLDTLGWTYYHAQRYDQALAVLEKLVRENASMPLARYHLGMVYFRQGDHDKAREHLARAMEARVDFKGIDEARATLAQLQPAKSN